MDVRVVSRDGVQRHSLDELSGLLGGPGVVWVDVPFWDDDVAAVLTEHFDLHPRAVRDCAERNPVPKVHVYADHVFVVLHAPERGVRGHVHYVELDQFVGPGYLVTVHGPLNPAVRPEAALVETGGVARRLEFGRLRPGSAAELSFAIVTALTNRLRDYLAALTEEVWRLERRVTAGHIGDAEQFLEELFQVRHGLLAVRTMAALSREVYGRMATVAVFGPGAENALLSDIEDQFRRIAAMADSQQVPAGRDRVLSDPHEHEDDHRRRTASGHRGGDAPVTALSSIIGMNVIVNDSTQVGPLAVLLAVMALMSGTLLLWARRKGWW